MVQLFHLLVSQVPTVEIKVAIDTGLVHGLGDDAPALLHTPHKQHLLGSFTLLLRELQQGWVLVERRVGGSQARVTGAVNALGGVVRNKLGRGVVGVQLDLVDGRDDLAAGVIQEDL